MQKEFWLERWRNKEIAFHQKETNPLLVKYLSKLSLKKGQRIFVPLCGKTLDIVYLVSQGYQVVGAELSEIAVREFFSEINQTPHVRSLPNMHVYSTDTIEIFVGDIFDLTADVLGHVDAVYDRAALVALPESMRERYTQHIRTITQDAAQFVICYEYDSSQMSGPPFSICPDEVSKHYSQAYQITLLESLNVEGGLKNKCEAKEYAWLLTH